MAISGGIIGNNETGRARKRMRHPVLPLLALLLAVAGGVLPADAQQSVAPVVAAQEHGQSFLDRMVQVRAQPVPNGPIVAGYGFIVADRPLSNWQPGFLIVTADHLLLGTGTSAPNAHPPAAVRFYADLTRAAVAEVLDAHLAPGEGDLAVLAVPQPPLPAIKPAVMGSQALAAGMPAWQLGTPAGWTPAAANARFALRNPKGGLEFDGLDGAPESAGGAIVTEFGLSGMVVGRTGDAPAVRVLPVELLAAKFAEWGLPWDIPALGTRSATPPAAAKSATPGAQASAAQPPPPRPPPAALLPPVNVLTLLPTELASRANWTPEGARASPWPGSGAPLLGSPTRGGTRVGALPPGRLLPQDLWARGAYEIQTRLDNGAWFLLASEGRPIGYVAGTDVVEVWPTEKAGTAADGAVVREIAAPGGKAVLRDAKTHYTLTIPLTCALAYCDSVLIYTPVPPSPGSITPTLQFRQTTGTWHQNDAFEVTVPLPRAVAETKGTQLMACVGLQYSCRQQAIDVGG